MALRSLVLVTALACGLVYPSRAHAIIECNEETVGQPCDTDDTVCTQERCVMIGLSVECRPDGLLPQGSACESDELVCTRDLCMGATCQHAKLPVGTVCFDGLFCTDGEKCDADGQCLGGLPTCDDKNVCTDDSCDEDADTCTNAAKPPCPADGNPCTTDACDPSAGCNYAPEPTTVTCNDDLFCSQDDHCDGFGRCRGALNCIDANPCTDDTCDEAADTCSNEPKNGGSCDDANVCTGDDTCVTGNCVGTAVDNGTPCTGEGGCQLAGTCQSGVCSGTSDAPDGTPCNDGNECTTMNSCLGGECGEGAPLQCYDGEFGPPCQTVGCDPTEGCVGIPIPDCADAGPPPPIPDAGLPDAEPGPDAFTPFGGQLGGGGCGCQSTSSADGWWLVLGLAFFLRRRRALVVLVFLIPTAARAQGFDAQIFRPAPALTGYVTQESADTLPSGYLHVVATFDSADDPLVLRDPQSGEILDGGVVLSSRSSLTLGAAVGLPGHLELSLAAPLAVAQSGDLMRVRPGDELASNGMGDLRAGAKWRFAAAGPMRFALALGASFPTGNEDDLTGSGSVVVTPRLLLGAQSGRFSATVGFGYSLRDAAGAGDLIVDDEFLVGGGLRVDLTDALALVGEAYGAFGTQGDGNEREAPVEAVAGPRFRVFGPWVVQAGAGVGVTHGYGTPAVRGFFALAYAPAPPRKITAVVEKPWTPPDEPEKPDVVAEPSDRDGDGLPDDGDQCPDEPEDKDGVDDEDGCPDPDADGDGIADKDDKCPAESEIVNGVDDQDGCPDEGLFELVEDRIVLEEKVLFDTNRARVKSGGKKVLSAVVVLWKQHPEWGKMIIEGHTDERGTDEWNMELGKLRAERVRDALIEAGFPPERLEVVSYGRSRPRAEGRSAEAWEKNRRVEFVIIKQEKKPVLPSGETPKPTEVPVPR